GQVKAKALLLASMTDRTIPGYLTRELYHGLKDATYVEIPSIRGHGAGGSPPGTAEYAYISEKVKTFLAGLPKIRRQNVRIRFLRSPVPVGALGAFFTNGGSGGYEVVEYYRRSIRA